LRRRNSIFFASRNKITAETRRRREIHGINSFNARHFPPR
jgi:hypothetical protein